MNFFLESKNTENALTDMVLCGGGNGGGNDGG